MLTLLDNLHTLQEKTEKAVFRERASGHLFHVVGVLTYPSDVLPLVYNALESEHAPVCARWHSSLLELYLVVKRFKNEPLGLYLVYVRALIMPKSKAFSSRELRCGLTCRSHSRLTDDTTARFHENTHSVCESSYSRHFLKYGQNT